MVAWYSYSSSSATAGTSATWISYNTTATSSTTYVPYTYYTFAREYIGEYPGNTPTETEEQMQARLRQEEVIRQEKEAAVKCAEELLREHIGSKAFKELNEVGYIELDSQKYKGRKYRVSKSAFQRIEVIEGNKVVDELCIVPTVQCPDGDKILSKVVLLELAEEYTLQTANHFRR